MRVEVAIPSTENDGRVFLSYVPVQATARLMDGPGSGQAVPVELRNNGARGKLAFDLARTHRGAPTLRLDLPGDGAPVRFWVAGSFAEASQSFGDAVLSVVRAGTAEELGTVPAMVRIRKDAQSLSAGERDRFLKAFGGLNGSGTGRFSDFRAMHVASTLRESHGNYGFLPWHRAYLLDLERELQNIDPQVALPYWRFDKPAPALFTPEFLGEAEPSGRLRFSAGHPLQTWRSDGQLGIVRSPRFDTNGMPSLRSEEETLAFGGGAFATFSVLDPAGPESSGIEIDPHGFAHTSFTGPIQSPPTAPRDPLFFLLHNNVDRLWAKWQWFYKRMADADPDSYPREVALRIGHNLDDTMWPWNGSTQAPRPSFPPPGGTLAASVVTGAPGPSPKVRSMIDYQGVHGGANLGFDYDDVPFEAQDPIS